MDTTQLMMHKAGCISQLRFILARQDFFSRLCHVYIVILIVLISKETTFVHNISAEADHCFCFRTLF
jgi:cytochrome c oxidase subunit IV